VKSAEFVSSEYENSTNSERSKKLSSHATLVLIGGVGNAGPPVDVGEIVGGNDTVSGDTSTVAALETSKAGEEGGGVMIGFVWELLGEDEDDSVSEVAGAVRLVACLDVG